MDKNQLVNQLKLDIDILKMTADRLSGSNVQQIDLDLLQSKTLAIYDHISGLMVMQSLPEFIEDKVSGSKESELNAEIEKLEEEWKALGEARKVLDEDRHSLSTEKKSFLEEQALLAGEKKLISQERLSLENKFRFLEEEKELLKIAKKELESKNSEETRIHEQTARTKIPEPAEDPVTETVIPAVHVPLKETGTVEHKQTAEARIPAGSDTPDSARTVSVHKAVAPKSEKTALHEKFSVNGTSINDMLTGKSEKNGIADKIQKGKISDLKTAISLHQRILFIKELFNGDEKEYRKFVDFINKSENYSEVKYFIHSEIQKKPYWNEKQEILEVLIDLINRKFL